MKRFGITIIHCIFFTGCIFSGNDVEENQVTGNYYISSMAGNNNLIYKEPGAETDHVILPGNVDSIGWTEKIVVGFSRSHYFIINVKSKAVERYQDRNLFRIALNESGIEKEILMKKVIGAQFHGNE